MIQKPPITALCLISSCGCNLNCKYCHIAKSKKSIEYATNLQKKTIEALKDGSFLNNIKAVYKYFNQDIKNIKEVSLWGQEPTLTLKYLTENLNDWVEEMPFWESLFFSTNGVSNAEDICDFIIALDNIIDHPFTLNLQISYDGEWSCINQRGVSSDIIKNSYKTIIENLNNKVLRFVKLTTHFHGVLSFENIYRMKTSEDILYYYKDFDNIVVWAKNLIKNPALNTDGQASINFEMPYLASTFDGLELANFVKKSISLNDDEFQCGNPIYSIIRRAIAENDIRLGLYRDGNWKDFLNSAINKNYTANNNFKRSNFDFSNRMFCGSYRAEYKIMYDGTVIGCQNYIYNTVEEGLNEEDSCVEYIKKNLIKHNYHFNPLDGSLSRKEIDKIIQIYIDGGEESFITSYQSSIDMMILLAQCGQIDREYLKDREKLLRHGIYITLLNSCFYNNLVISGSHYLKNAGLYRMYCNGYLDLVDQYLNNFYQEEKN